MSQPNFGLLQTKRHNVRDCISQEISIVGQSMLSKAQVRSLMFSLIHCSLYLVSVKLNKAYNRVFSGRASFKHKSSLRASTMVTTKDLYHIKLRKSFKLLQ